MQEFQEDPPPNPSEPWWRISIFVACGGQAVVRQCHELRAPDQHAALCFATARILDLKIAPQHELMLYVDPLVGPEEHPPQRRVF